MKETYRNIPNSGTPLGGLGTGTIELRPDGRFHHWQIFNGPPWTPASPVNQNQDNTLAGWNFGSAFQWTEPVDTESLIFLFWARKKAADAVPQLRVLALDCDPLHTNRHYLPFLRMPGRIEYSGEFPVTTLRYLDMNVPFEVTGRFVSPFIPGDPAASATPGFYADFEIKPLSCGDWDISITAILVNTTSWERTDLLKRNQVLRQYDGSIFA